MLTRVILAIGAEFRDDDDHVTLGHWPGRREHGDGPAASGDRYGFALLDLAEQPGQVGLGFVAADGFHAGSFHIGSSLMHLVYTRFASLPSGMGVGLDTKLPIPPRKSGVTRHVIGDN